MWLLAVVLGAIWIVVPSHLTAQAQTQAGTVRFNGQVLSVDGAGHNPTGFSLQLPGRTVDLRVAPKAVFKAMSAEAEVEGFQIGDYAVVDARRVDKAWVAATIEFDVQPIRPGPRQTMVSGAIQRVSVTGLRFLLKLDTGDMHWISITRKTRFKVDGQLSTLPPLLQKGQSVDVLVSQAPRGWIALEIDLKSGSPPFRES